MVSYNCCLSRLRCLYVLHLAFDWQFKCHVFIRQFRQNHYYWFKPFCKLYHFINIFCELELNT